MFDLKEHPHRRFNPLTREWVLVSPHRTKRPWQGQVEKLPAATRPQYDPKCYLCPGNERAGGHKNPVYEKTFSFENDFAALLPGTPEGGYGKGELFRAEAERGLCKVVCFSPRHDLTVAEMSVEEIEPVVDTWVEEFKSLNALPWMGYVQIFENRGEMMGCSNPHPHCQIWSSSSVPNEIHKEDVAQREYWHDHGSAMLTDYLAAELESGERIVSANRSWVALVPFWAVWPFETMLIPRRAIAAMDEMDAEEKSGLAAIMKSLTTRYDNLFEVSFPYSMGFHQRPSKSRGEGWHLHAHYHPPLLRSATVRKFLVGYELLATAQRDITPESAAERLRGMSETHYTKRV
jgi:UDPglucose--hexose-1-phosphate uridylyltransferase